MKPKSVELRYYRKWSLSDESLLAGMASGDVRSATVFVRRYQARVYGLARTIVGDPAVAEDVAQEAFVRAWRHAGAYDPRKGRATTWLLTITRNLAVDAARLRREEPVDPHELVTTLLAAQPPDRDQQDEASVRQALRDLPPEQARAVALVVFYAMTSKEVADLEGIPLGTAKTRIRRGLVKLRKRLEVSDG
ncbi:sigma-70 family RNA polymerase sigma factor [Acrocarpospora sp. B8E8]|uniref:RNA polymerase sigma factor n=1 Tax=Acrocarpospora sp. B8E8 TaxID=3153572 RepID=UPI00325F5566